MLTLARTTLAIALLTAICLPHSAMASGIEDFVEGCKDAKCVAQGRAAYCAHEFATETPEQRMDYKRCLKWAKEPGPVENQQRWEVDCRRGYVEKSFNREDLEPFDPRDLTREFKVYVGETIARIARDEFREILKDLPRITRALKACDAWHQCLADRDAGKVKHCYANDRRWREFLGGNW
jgi:hypothetical protein